MNKNGYSSGNRSSLPANVNEMVNMLVKSKTTQVDLFALPQRVDSVSVKSISANKYAALAKLDNDATILNEV